MILFVVALASFLLGWELHMIWSKWRAHHGPQSPPSPSPEALEALDSIKQSHRQLTSEAPQVREMARSTVRHSDTRARRIALLKAERRVLTREPDEPEVS